MGEVDDMDETIYVVYDEEEPFNDDLLKVLEVYDEEGELLPINDKYKDNSVFTPSFDTLTMIPADPAEYITLIYQAAPNKIVLTANFDPERYEIDVPGFLKEALLLYVASRVFRSIKRGAKEGPSEASSYMIDFETACMKLKIFGMIPDNNETSAGFEDNGWT
jgi:hypothetical protein